MKKVFDQHHYLLDPHGAVGYAALEKYLSTHSTQKGIIVETAHPVKFYDVVEPVIHEKIEIPDSIYYQLHAPKIATSIASNTIELKEFLLTN